MSGVTRGIPSSDAMVTNQYKSRFDFQIMVSEYEKSNCSIEKKRNLERKSWQLCKVIKISSHFRFGFLSMNSFI